MKRGERNKKINNEVIDRGRKRKEIKGRVMGGKERKNEDDTEGKTCMI